MDVLELVRAEEVLRQRGPEPGGRAATELEPGRFEEAGGDSWVQYTSDDGFPYWHNAATDESRWEPPTKAPPSGLPASTPKAMPPLARPQLGNRESSVWNFFETDNGEPYWHNPATGESRWEDPNQPPPQAPPSQAVSPSHTPLGVFMANETRTPGKPPATKAWIQIGLPVTAMSRVSPSLIP